MKRAFILIVVLSLMVLPFFGTDFSLPVANAMMIGGIGHGGMGGMGSHDQSGTMDAKTMADAMKSSKFPSMMAQNANMQQAFMSMMQTPEMQSTLRQLMQQDPNFKNMMVDLINSANGDPKNITPSPSQAAGQPSGHNH